MPSAAVVDTGPLLAAADRADPRHADTVALLERTDLRLSVPALVAGEAAAFIGRRAGPAIEARFLAGLEDVEVTLPRSGDWRRIAELVERYAGWPLGGVDASVVALAERLGTEVVLTFDERHFGAVRPRHVDALTLLP